MGKRPNHAELGRCVVPAACWGNAAAGAERKRDARLEKPRLLSVTGASGVGKSTTLAVLTDALRDEPVTCVEFDSLGIPADADTAWRHGTVEEWMRRAVS